MRFIQNRHSGEAEMIFEDKEIEIIKKNKKLIFTPEYLKIFGDCLMKIIIDWNSNFNSDLQKKLTQEEDVLDLSKNDTSNK